MEPENNIPPELEALHIVTAESLASNFGLLEDGRSNAMDEIKLKRTSYQVFLKKGKANLLYSH